MPKFKLALIALSIFSLLVSLLYLKSQVSKAADGRYPLLAKRIFIEDPDDILVNFSPLRAQLKEYFKNIGQRHSFYFEYLFTGTSIRIGENEELVGASLLKVPLAMDLYKAAEINKIQLDVPIEIRSEDIDPHFGNLWQKGVGAKLTLEEAAKILLVDSDNTAGNLILRNIKGILSEDDKSEIEIDMATRNSPDMRSLITAKSYSSIFKCLYVSCFTTKENSHKMLDYLTQSKHDHLLQAGLPEGIRMAHKIGSFSDKVQSDCGIVYVPKRAYIICVMIESSSDEAKKIIPEVSRKVYQYVTSQ